jgi:hypothetical protein
MEGVDQAWGHGEFAPSFLTLRCSLDGQEHPFITMEMVVSVDRER